MFISYSCIYYFGDACPKLNIVFISLVTGKCLVFGPEDLGSEAEYATSRSRRLPTIHI